MKPEQQVTSLEISKKLKELGVKQNSLFYWQSFNDFKDKAILSYGKEFSKADSISAFTVAELGELLPNQYVSGKTDLSLYNCWEIEIGLIKNYNPFQELKEVDARGKMLIYLLENKLIAL